MKKLAFLLVCCFVGLGAWAVPFTMLPSSGVACSGPGCGKDYPNGGPVEQGRCKDMSKNDVCTDSSKGEKRAVCMDLGGAELSCAAKECYDDSLLWFHKNNNGKYVPYGRCVEIDELQKKYCDVGCSCGKDQKCVVIERDIPLEFQSGRGGKAFFDKELCGCVEMTCDERFKSGTEAWKCCLLQEDGVDVVMKDGKCQCIDDNKKLNESTGECEDVKEEKKEDPKEDPKPKPEPEEEKECWYEFTGYYKCDDGGYVLKHKSYKLSKDDVEKLRAQCVDGKAIIDNDREEFFDWAKKMCKDSDNRMVDDSMEAKKRIDAFLLRAEKDTSVWKNKEGKFNTARLASDLTAGVVLGTVGGIVSANVIKKKQIEKGFDALNCTVGGQKIADWGDVFNVGLRRY